MGILGKVSKDESGRIVRAEIEKKGCLVCDNYHAIHHRTKQSYCQDGSKTVFADSGCKSWSRTTPNTSSTP